MSAPRTLLVDLDGTLTDNFEGISRSIRHALAAVGAADVDVDELRACVGPPLRQTFARLLGTGEPAAIERVLARYRERFADVGWQENVRYGGVDAALATLRSRRHRLLVCTSKPEPYAVRIVAKFDLARHFDGVYAADLGGKLDDKAALVRHVIEREKLDATACAIIGDREHDVRAAHANRIRAIGVLWGYGSRSELELAGADAIVATPDALPSGVDALD